MYSLCLGISFEYLRFDSLRQIVLVTLLLTIYVVHCRVKINFRKIFKDRTFDCYYLPFSVTSFSTFIFGLRLTVGEDVDRFGVSVLRT